MYIDPWPACLRSELAQPDELRQQFVPHIFGPLSLFRVKCSVEFDDPARRRTSLIYLS